MVNLENGQAAVLSAESHPSGLGLYTDLAGVHMENISAYIPRPPGNTFRRFNSIR